MYPFNRFATLWIIFFLLSIPFARSISNWNWKRDARFGFFCLSFCWDSIRQHIITFRWDIENSLLQKISNSLNRIIGCHHIIRVLGIRAVRNEWIEPLTLPVQLIRPFFRACKQRIRSLRSLKANLKTTIKMHLMQKSWKFVTFNELKVRWKLFYRQIYITFFLSLSLSRWLTLEFTALNFVGHEALAIIASIISIIPSGNS